MPKSLFPLLVAALVVPAAAQNPSNVPSSRECLSHAAEALHKHNPTLRDHFVVPDNDVGSQFCEEIAGCQQEISLVEYELRKILEEMDALPANPADGENARGQAKYEFVRARLERRIVCLAAYNLLLGQLRREVRANGIQGIKGGCRLIAASGEITDREVEHLQRQSRNRLEQLRRRHKGTPWEMLARRELLAPLNFQWQPLGK